jgi:hypothetical protein
MIDDELEASLDETDLGTKPVDRFMSVWWIKVINFLLLVSRGFRDQYDERYWPHRRVSYSYVRVRAEGVGDEAISTKADMAVRTLMQQRTSRNPDIHVEEQGKGVLTTPGESHSTSLVWGWTCWIFSKRGWPMQVRRGHWRDMGETKNVYVEISS